jgi:hypothetical protein
MRQNQMKFEAKMTNTAIDDLILQELQRTPIQNLTLDPPKPYTEDMLYTEKVKRTYQALLRARRMKNRVWILINAFFLGELLNGDDITPAQRTLQSQTITAHYYQCSTRIYFLFENLGSKQILNTRFLTLTWIRRLKTKEYQDLLNRILEISVGTEILRRE